MKSIKIRVYAKINLTLDVVGRRADGYHNVDMVMQSVDLWDELIIKEIDRGIELDSNIHNLPRDKGNIAWRAAELVKKEFGIAQGVKIFIKKGIPIEAGMAGGSADCAGVLLGLNELWNLDLDGERLQGLGKSLGADVPFCLMGGTALAQGIGDVLKPIESKTDMWLAIVKPEFGVSTQEIYGGLRLEDIDKRPDNKSMIEYLENGRVRDIAENLVNVLEGVTIPIHAQIARIKDQLMSLGALGSLMTGSGPAVYGIFGDESAAREAAKVLRKTYRHVYAIRTIQKGINIYPENP